MTSSPSHPDGTAPVLDHEHDVARACLVQRSREICDVALEREVSEIMWLVASAEADVIGDENAVVSRQIANELAIEEPPSRVAMHAEKRERCAESRAPCGQRVFRAEGDIHHEIPPFAEALLCEDGGRLLLVVAGIGVAELVRMVFTWSGVRAGLASSMSATVPDTWGVA